MTYAAAGAFYVHATEHMIIMQYYNTAYNQLYTWVVKAKLGSIQLPSPPDSRVPYCLLASTVWSWTTELLQAFCLFSK